MLSHVEFRSSAFAAEPGEDEEVNPGLYGRALASWLAQALHAVGERPGEVFAEDWGWVVPLENDGFDLWIGAGHYQEYEDGFLCFIHPDTPTIRRWFKKIHVEDRVEALRKRIDQVLNDNPEVHDIKWWARDDFINPTSGT